MAETTLAGDPLNELLAALEGGNYYTGGKFPTQEVKYFFDPKGEKVSGSPAVPGDTEVTLEWSSDEKRIFRESAGDIAAVANVKFAEITDVAKKSGANIIAQLTFIANGGNGGYASLGPGGTQYVVGNIKGDRIGQELLKITVIHELGHVLGLKHPFEGNLLPGLEAGAGAADAPGDFGFNSRYFSMMAYRVVDEIPGYGSQKFAATTGLAPLDIAVLQEIYGINGTTESGDTIYGPLGANTIKTIWDAGGFDTIDFGTATTRAVIDLRAASLLLEEGGLGRPSYIVPENSNTPASAYFIANGATIEGGKGGSGDDTITGNAVNNVLDGRLGSDRLSGGEGDDTLVGGTSTLPKSIDLAQLGAGTTGPDALAATGLAEMSGNFTLEISLKLDNPTQSQQIFLYNGDSTGGAASQNFALIYKLNASGEPVLDFRTNGPGGSSGQPPLASSLADGELHRIVITRDSATGTNTIYLDGVRLSRESGIAAGHEPASGGTLTVGAVGSADPRLQAEGPLQGAVSEIALYDKVLSDKTIADGTPLSIVTDTDGLVSHWKANTALPGFTTRAGATALDGLPDSAFVTEFLETDDDILAGGNGNDTLIGGAGTDTAVFNLASTSITTKLEGTDLIVSSAEGRDVVKSDVEFFKFTDKTLSFDAVAKIGGDVDPPVIPDVEGTDGDDTNIGGTRKDELIEAYGGNDTVVVRGGNDTIDGGDGNDTISFEKLKGTQSKNLAVDLETGVATSSGKKGINTTLESIENVTGSKKNDALRGNGEDNVLVGGKGKDLLDGRGGNDVLYGDDKEDPIEPAGPVLAVLNNDSASNEQLRLAVGDMPRFATVEMIFRIDGTNSQDLLTYEVPGDSANEFNVIYLAGANETIRVGASGPNGRIRGPADVGTPWKNDGALHRITLVTEGAGLSLYIDGAKIDFGSNSSGIQGLPPGGTLNINKRYGFSVIEEDRAFRGAIGDIAIYNRVFTAAEIAARGGVGSVGKPGDANLVGLWSPNSNLNAHETLVGTGDVEKIGAVEYIETSPSSSRAAQSGGDDTLVGGSGNDTIYGGGGTDRAVFDIDLAEASFFADGADLIVSSPEGRDVIKSDVETLVFADGQISVAEAFNIANDPIKPTGGDDKLVGTVGNDRIESGGGKDSVSGGSGNDTILGGADNDELHGNEDDDDVNGGTGADVITGGTGNDKLNGASGGDSVYGDDGDDFLIGGTGNDKLWGGTGNDDLSGQGGNNELYGDAGDDKLEGGRENDTLYGGEGNDTVFGQAGADKLYGEAGDDSLFGGTGNDLIVAGGGADSLDGGSGDDVLIASLDTAVADGGSGEDTLQIESNASGVVVNLAAQNMAPLTGALEDPIYKSSLYRLDPSDISKTWTEAVAYSLDQGGRLLQIDSIAENDFITTTFTPIWTDQIWIGATDEVTEGSFVDLNGNPLGATLDNWAEGEPNSFFEAEDYVVLVSGGEWADGVNTPFFDTRTIVEIDLATSSDFDGPAAAGSVRNVENVVGTDYDDWIFGDSGKNALDGGDGDDVLRGEGGSDVLRGGDGDDALAGGTGNDLLIGDAGADRFAFSGDFGTDTITDFASHSMGGDADLIDLRPIADTIAREYGVDLEFDDLAIIQVKSGVQITLNVDLNDNGRPDTPDLDGDGSGDRVAIVLTDRTVVGLNADDFLF